MVEGYAFVFHPENMLLGMIPEEKQEIRKLGKGKIEESKRQVCYNFLINLSAANCSELIYWTKHKMSPPMIQSLTTKYISSFLQDKNLRTLMF